LTLYLLYSDASDAEKERQVLEEFAKPNKGTMLFCATQVKEDFGARLGEFVGVDPDTKPIFLFMDFLEESIQKYRYEGEVSVDGLSAWVEQVVAGEA